MRTDGSGPFHVAPAPGTLEAARRGDRAALAELFRLYARPAYNLAVRMLGDAMSAEDVVQDVFERLGRDLAGYRGDAPFGAWLRRAVANAAIDEIRRRQWLDRDTAVEDRVEPDGLGGVDEQAIDAWRLLGRLPPAARAALVLHAVEGFTHAEMAELFGRSESYSKSLISRALARLRGALAMDPRDLS